MSGLEAIRRGVWGVFSGTEIEGLFGWGELPGGWPLRVT